MGWEGVFGQGGNGLYYSSYAICTKLKKDNLMDGKRGKEISNHPKNWEVYFPSINVKSTLE